MSATVPPPDVVIAEESLPAQGLHCPMCGGTDIRARQGTQREEGVNVTLSCATCGNWYAVMFVSWIELFPEIAGSEQPDEAD